MTAAELAELARLEAAATPGPWENDGEFIQAAPYNSNSTAIASIHGADDFPCLDAGDYERCDRECDANAGLIVAARNHLPALLQEIAQLRATEGLIGLRARIAELEAALAQAVNHLNAAGCYSWSVVSRAVLENKP